MFGKGSRRLFTGAYRDHAIHIPYKVLKSSSAYTPLRSLDHAITMGFTNSNRSPIETCDRARVTQPSSHRPETGSVHLRMLVTVGLAPTRKRSDFTEFAPVGATRCTRGAKVDQRRSKRWTDGEWLGHQLKKCPKCNRQFHQTLFN